MDPDDVFPKITFVDNGSSKTNTLYSELVASTCYDTNMRTERAMATQQTSTRAPLALGDLGSQLQFQEFVQGLLSQKEQISEEEREILMELNSEGEDEEEEEDEAVSLLKMESKTDLVPVMKVEPNVTNSLVKIGQKRKIHFPETINKLEEGEQLSENIFIHDTQRNLEVKKFASLACRTSTDDKNDDKKHHNIEKLNHSHNLDHSKDNDQYYSAFIKIPSYSLDNESILPDLIEHSEPIVIPDSPPPFSVNPRNFEGKNKYLTKKPTAEQHSPLFSEFKVADENLVTKQCIVLKPILQQNPDLGKYIDLTSSQSSTGNDKQASLNFLGTSRAPVQIIASPKNSQSVLIRRVVSNVNTGSKGASQILSQMQKEQVENGSVIPEGITPEQSTISNGLQFRKIVPKGCAVVQNPKNNILSTLDKYTLVHTQDGQLRTVKTSHRGQNSKLKEFAKSNKKYNTLTGVVQVPEQISQSNSSKSIITVNFAKSGNPQVTSTALPNSKFNCESRKSEDASESLSNGDLNKIRKDEMMANKTLNILPSRITESNYMPTTSLGNVIPPEHLQAEIHLSTQSKSESQTIHTPQISVNNDGTLKLLKVTSQAPNNTLSNMTKNKDLIKSSESATKSSNTSTESILYNSLMSYPGKKNNPENLHTITILDEEDKMVYKVFLSKDKKTKEDDVQDLLSICSQSSSNTGNRNANTEQLHSFKCSFCDKKYKELSDLLHHYKQGHWIKSSPK